MVDVRDDLLVLPDVAVQPVHPPCSGSCHLHARLPRFLDSCAGMAAKITAKTRTISKNELISAPLSEITEPLIINFYICCCISGLVALKLLILQDVTGICIFCH